MAAPVMTSVSHAPWRNFSMMVTVRMPAHSSAPMMWMMILRHQLG